MKHEFKVTRSKEQTVYTIEAATGGSSSTGDMATVDSTLGGMQRRNPPGDNILAQEKKETPKPRNFVAKNAKMGGAGQHKDKKKAEKQGDVKHKKPLAESSYAEDLAKQVFDANPNIKDENAVLDAAWPIAVQDLGNKRAMSVFNYDEDFPSDLVSVYGWLQKDQQGVAEEEEDKIDSRFKKTEWMPLLDAIKILKHYGATPEKYMGHDMFPYYDREGNRKYLDDISWNADNSKNVRVSLVNAAVRELKTQQQDVAEDHEIQMASSELQSIAKNAVHLLDLVRKYSEEQGLDAWQQSKITKAADYLNSVLQSVSGEQTKLEGAGMPFRGVGGAFNRGDDERHDLDPTEWYIVKDGKMFKTTVYPNQVQKAISQGFSPSREEAKSKADNVEESGLQYSIGVKKHGKEYMTKSAQLARDGASQEELGALKDRLSKAHKGKDNNEDVEEAAKKGLYYYVNKRKKAGTSRPASSPKAPSAQAWKDAAKTAKKESADTYFESLTNMLERSVSQAQHNLMVGVANNPAFAQKVKVKQNVGQEFANADQGHDISKLPIRVPKKK